MWVIISGYDRYILSLYKYYFNASTFFMLGDYIYMVTSQSINMKRATTNVAMALYW